MKVSVLIATAKVLALLAMPVLVSGLRSHRRPLLPMLLSTVRPIPLL